MMAGLPLSSQAIGDAGRRDLPTEWGGPVPDAARIAERRTRADTAGERRIAIRKP